MIVPNQSFPCRSKVDVLTVTPAIGSYIWRFAAAAVCFFVSCFSEVDRCFFQWKSSFFLRWFVIRFNWKPESKSARHLTGVPLLLRTSIIAVSSSTCCFRELLLIKAWTLLFWAFGASFSGLSLCRSVLSSSDCLAFWFRLTLLGDLPCWRQLKPAFLKEP